MTRAQSLAVIATCLVAAMTYAGAVTMDGMGLFVLPGVVGAALLGSFLAGRRMFGTALILGGALVLGWSELVNIWSGTAAGPAARATAVASACTLLAVVVARSDSPALFLVTIAGSVCGALLLGSGSEVRSVAVAAVVSAALTLGWIERSRRNWTATSRRGPALLLLSLLVGAVAAGVVLLQVQRDRTPPEALAAGQVYPRIKPPWHDPLGTAKPRSRPPASSPSQSQGETAPRRHGSVPPPRTRHHHHPHANPSPVTTAAAHGAHSAAHSHLWLYVLAAILLFVDLVTLALAARLLAVRLAWRRLRRRLAAGAPAEQVTGAWAWARMRLEACRLPLPAALSPDLVAAGDAAVDLPAAAVSQLQRLATWTTAAAFANEHSLAPADAFAAWLAARRTEASARELLTWHARVRLAFRGPAAKAVTG